MPESNSSQTAEPNLRTFPSPHIHDEKGDSNRIMQDVLLALTPAILGSLYIFGFHVLPYYIVAVGTAMILDYCWRRVVRKQVYRFDWTPVVTGVLLAMSLPANAPLWFPLLGAAVAILIAKELFGGTGKNFLNPAITGRIVLRVLFVDQMVQNVWPRPGIPVPEQVDVVSGATPLMVLKEGVLLENSSVVASLFGNVGGKIGETSAILLLIGAAYLLWRRVIRWRIPVILLATIALCALFIGMWSAPYGGLPAFVIGHLLGGATILGAFFMATDYSSSPSTPTGQIIFAIGLGVLTMAYRYLGAYSEGFTFALFIMNLLVPLLNRMTMPRVIGQ